MARNPQTAGDTGTNLPALPNGSTQAEGEKKQRNKRTGPLPPKVIYILVRDQSVKEGIMGVHTNTRTLVEAVDQNPGCSYVKVTLPKSERGEANAEAAGNA